MGMISIPYYNITGLEYQDAYNVVSTSGYIGSLNSIEALHDAYTSLNGETIYGGVITVNSSNISEVNTIFDTHYSTLVYLMYFAGNSNFTIVRCEERNSSRDGIVYYETNIGAIPYNGYYLAHAVIGGTGSVVNAGIYETDYYNSLDDFLGSLSELKYPITYRFTNCTAPSAPIEAAVGDTVNVPLVMQEGYGIITPSTDILVTNNGVTVPHTYSNGTISFTMPDPS